MRAAMAKRILVAENDKLNMRLFREVLTHRGYETIERENGLAALEAARAAPPDLILLDVQLPDANGFDLLALMRQHPVLKTLPVVMLTAEATRESVLRGLQGGADGYITKPFEPDVLVSAVKAVLGLTPPTPAPKK